MSILGNFKIDHDALDLQVNDRVSKIVPFAYEHTDGKEYLGLMYKEANKILETTQLTIPNANQGDLFGSSVAVDGTRLVVGAQLEDTAGNNAGKVYIYEWNGTSYDEVGTLTASDAEDYDYFGSAVALDGTRLIVGASEEDTASSGSNAGKIYIYEWNGTSYDEVATLTGSDAEPADYFGWSVAVDGTRLVVGAPGEDTAASGAGKVYIYEWNGTKYVQAATLTASDAQLGDYFGRSVALDGTRLVVGAHYADMSTGKVYIYEWNGTSYVEVGILTASDAEAGDYFGSGVALSGTRLVVGAPEESTAVFNAGKVYIYEWNGTSYDEVATLTASGAQMNGDFGWSVALDGTNLVVGAPGEDINVLNAGKVYVYSIDEYSESLISSTSSDYDGTLSDQDTKIVILDVELV